MKLSHLKPVATLLTLTAVMILPVFVFAQGTSNTTGSSNPMNLLKAVGTGGGSGPYKAADENTLPLTLGIIINSALGLLGIIFVGLIIYAGFHWMTASGNEQSVDKAKKTMTSATIGLVIVLSAWAIWNFVLYNIIARI